MKTILAALAAGVIGAGGAIAAVALELVPLPGKAQSAQVAPVLDEEHPAAPAGDNSAELETLRSEVRALGVKIEQSQAQKPVDNSKEIAALKAEIAALKSARPAPAAVEEPTEGPKAGAGEFEPAVRSVFEKIEAERREERRLERHADRIAELERTKTQISETLPRFIESQATRLNIPETAVTDVSNVLVTHLQARAESRSEREGQRIDGVEVDEEAYQKKLSDTDEATVVALSQYMDAEAAKNVVNAANRLGGGGGRGPAGGFQPGQGRPGRNNR